MSAIHFCIDMQAGDINLLPEDSYDALQQSILTTVQELAEQGIPTVYVAYLGEWEKFKSFENAVGLYRDTPPQIVRLMQLPFLRFVLPVGPRDLVAYKNDFSLVAGEPQLTRYLDDNNYTQIFLSGLFEGHRGHGHFDINGCCVSETAADLVKTGKYQATIIAEGTEVNFPGKYYDSLENRKAGHAAFGVAVETRADIMASLERSTRLDSQRLLDLQKLSY